MNALPLEWRERAVEILEDYDVDLGVDGMRCQGCCCGDRHRKLDVAAEDQLRDEGFLIA